MEIGKSSHVILVLYPTMFTLVTGHKKQWQQSITSSITQKIKAVMGGQGELCLLNYCTSKYSMMVDVKRDDLE